MYEYAGKSEDNYLKDLRLYDGALVKIDTENGNTITLFTGNAQIENMHKMENPVTETVIISGKTDGVAAKAGKDFPAGVYDLKATKGMGEVVITVYDNEGEEYENKYMYLVSGAQDGYRNLVLPENAEVSFQMPQSLELTLTPSEYISSSNYLKYYIYYLEGEDE